MSNKNLYHSFCQKEKDIPLFSKSWYLDAVCGANNWDVLMVKKGNEIAATMPFLITKKMGFSLMRMPLITPYWGPYFPKKFRSNSQQEKLIKALIQQMPKHDLFDQNFHHYFQNWLPFYWKNFEASVRYSFLIDLTKTLEEIYQNINADYRNNKIPKAQELVTIVTDHSLVSFFEVHEKTFSRQGLSSPFSFDFLKRFDQCLENYEARKIFFAIDKKNQIHSVVYLVWDDETAYFLIAGDDPKFRKHGASILIVWEVIKYAKEVLGKKQFDFAGSVIQSVTRVRRNFGAEQVGYFNIRKFNSKLLKILYVLKS